MSKPLLTVYIPRYITNELQYDMFLSCLENAIKYLSEFELNIIIICDNENEITKKYDPIIEKEFNVKFVQMEYKHISEMAGYLYHLEHKPSELCLMLFANNMLNKTISANTVLKSIEKYGMYTFAYNYCCMKDFNKIYAQFKSIFPESTLLDDYLHAKIGNPMYCSAQGNQMFTTYENLCKVKDSFPYYWNILETFDKLQYEDFKEGTFDKRLFNRQIRCVIEHFFTQLFFKTTSYPSEIHILGESDSCLYGFAVHNFLNFGKLLTGLVTHATNDHYHLWLKMKDDKRFTNYYTKFCSGEF